MDIYVHVGTNKNTVTKCAAGKHQISYEKSVSQLQTPG